MPLSRETLEAIARELWGVDVPPGEIEGAMALLGPALEGVAELDTLDLEPLEPAITFNPNPQ